MDLESKQMSMTIIGLACNVEAEMGRGSHVLRRIIGGPANDALFTICRKGSRFLAMRTDIYH